MPQAQSRGCQLCGAGAEYDSQARDKKGTAESNTTDSLPTVSLHFYNFQYNLSLPGISRLLYYHPVLLLPSIP